jgi:hypothetical protein
VVLVGIRPYVDQRAELAARTLHDPEVLERPDQVGESRLGGPEHHRRLEQPQPHQRGQR